MGYENLFEMGGRLISCIASTIIIFRFFDIRYIRTYDSGMVNVGIRIVCCLMNLSVYLLNSPIANMVFWILAILLISKIFYTDIKKKKGSFYLINISFLFLCSMCEAVGCLLVQAGVNILGITQNEQIISFVYTTGGTLSLIVLFHFLLQRILTMKKIEKITAIQYAVYMIIAAFALVNIGGILFLLQHKLTYKDYIFLLTDGVFVIILNLFFFYLLDTFSENKELKYKILLYERLSQDKYDYYVKQMESNRQTLSVIHDIRKHIQVLEGLNQIHISTVLKEYSDSFEEMIEPLLVKQYTNSAILNILIKDKVEYCERNAIVFDIYIKPIDMEFMKPIDITTVFGNILDNAIEACEKAKEKKISLKIYSFNGLVYVQINNTYEGEILRNITGRPISKKGEQHGIGLENVEKVLRDYNGDIEYIVTPDWFTVEIMFSKI